MIYHYLETTAAFYTEKSYKRPPHIFPSSSESKIRPIKIYDQMKVSVSFCIPICVIFLTQTKHE